jgi:hypothetical protein
MQVDLLKKPKKTGRNQESDKQLVGLETKYVKFSFYEIYNLFDFMIYEDNN